MITLTAPSQIWGHTKLVEFQLTIKLNHKSDKGHTQPAAATIQRLLTIVMIAVRSQFDRWWSPSSFQMKIKSRYQQQRSTLEEIELSMGQGK